MFIEKKRKGISPRLLTANGDSNGVITVASIKDLYVKQKIVLKSNTQPKLRLEIKRFISPTSFYVGEPGDIKQRKDISTYLVADGATISADEDDRPGITDKDYNRAAYMEEPVVAHRVVGVDPNGEMYDQDNPLPVAITGGNITIEGDVLVDLEAVDDFVKPDNAMAVGTEDGTKAGIRHVHKIDSDKRLHVKDEASIAAIGDVNTELETANTILQQIEDNTDGIEASLSSIESAIDSVGSAVDTSNTILQQIEDNTDGLEAKLDDIAQAITDQEPIKISGTENGQTGGTEHVFVNNRRLQILAARDMTQSISYADFGTKNQRVVQIEYTAPTIGVGAGFTAVRTFSYTLVGTRYRRDSISWSIV